ncbi:MAG: pyridoxal phosphate-dependent aminotransferase [Myxococcales bacterium]|nr:pyridoxal phosphate-dependent aminotransferase [Myxococcales bacterium]
MVAFSQRTAWSRRPNELAELRATLGDTPIDDLTESNPTRAGLACEPAVLGWLADPGALRYAPEPLGLLAARAEVARYYAVRGGAVEPEAVALAASSSEAYAWLFHLLCDPGDVVLVPRPSYPLLPYLAELAGVTLVPYPLLREEAFRVDIGAVERLLGGPFVAAAGPRASRGRVRAIVLVHPNNPTGSLVRRSDARALGELARAHGVALVVDEVFLDYPLGPHPDAAASFAGFETALTFVLSGLSKVALLPQLKLGWVVASGPPADVREAMARLEIVADSFLSVSTPVQLALGRILGHVPEVQARLRARLARNLGALDAALDALGPGSPLRRLPSEAGWYATLEVPRTRSDDEWLALLLREERVLVHPGYFFDGASGDLVVSLLCEPVGFAAACARAVTRLAAG